MRNFSRKFSKIKAAGFTLIELLVVVTIIGLLAGIAVPSALKLFSSSADIQAYNLFNAQLSYARAVAIENQSYAGVHSQMAAVDDDNDAVKRLKLEGRCVTGIVWYNSDTDFFELVAGTKPKPLPSKMAFGRITTDASSSSEFVNSSGDYTDFDSSDNQKINGQYVIDPDFTTLSVIFDGEGEIVSSVPRESTSHNDDLFDPNETSSPTYTGGTTSAKRKRIWDYNDLNPTLGVTMFNYKEAIDASKTSTDIDDDELTDYLNENAQFLPVNIYTGRMLPRE